MRAIKFSPDEMQRFVDRQRQQLEQLHLPLRPIFAPVDDAYPAWLTRWSLPPELPESLSFAAGARQGLPRVTVDNRPAGVPVPTSYRPAPSAEDTEPASVFVDGVAWPARVQHQAGDRIYVLDIDGTSVVVAANGRRSPDRVELHRVTDIGPYRRRTLELNQQDPDGSLEWQNPDAWENPPDTTAPWWAYRGLLLNSAIQLREVRDRMSRRPVEWPPPPASYVHDGGHWWAAAQHEQHRLTVGTQTEANDIVHDMVQLVSLLCAHAAWWQNDSLRDRAVAEIAMYRTGTDSTVASAAAQRIWAQHPSQGTGPTPAPGSGSDLVLTAWQRWAEQTM